MSHGREEIVDKLHGALAAFRRERDDLHRKKELASERLRLVSEEREAMQKTVRNMQDKINELHKSISEEGKAQLIVMEQEVERLNRETQFQHNELVGKKDKIARLEAQLEEECATREISICAAQDAVKKRRNKMHAQRKPDLSKEEQEDRMQKELQEVGNDRVWPKWPRLVEQKATEVAMQAGDLHRSSESLHAVIAGYKKCFGHNGILGNVPIAMEQ